MTRTTIPSRFSHTSGRHNWSSVWRVPQRCDRRFQPEMAGPQREVDGPQREVVGPHREVVGPHREVVGPQREMLGPQLEILRPSADGRDIPTWDGGSQREWLRSQSSKWSGTSVNFPDPTPSTKL